MMEEHFTKQEATALIGKTFESIVEFSGVPKGTRGQVVAADAGGMDHWDVIIEWSLSGQSKLLHDWFTKSEMGKYMRETPALPEGSGAGVADSLS